MVPNKVAMAYFYFDFNNPVKQHSDAMIRAMITQLLGQSVGCFSQLESLFTSPNNVTGHTDIKRLTIIFKDVLKTDVDKIFIVLDAIDECSGRRDLFERIKDIVEWLPHKTHLILLSRKIFDIEEAFNQLTKISNPLDKTFDLPNNYMEAICIESALVDEDIRIYVDEKTQTDPGLQRWKKMPSVQEEIRRALVSQAGGM